jgi:putative molybdopterin biosynthesis protein
LTETTKRSEVAAKAKLLLMPKPGDEEEVPARPLEQESYLTVRQLAEYLHVNEKKIYLLIKDGTIPATKVTGKWLFPRQLIDEWMLESTHGGALTDRLVVSGSDDPLLAAGLAALAEKLEGNALITYLPTGSRAGLALLARRLANVSAIHWGPADAADRQHRTLVSQYPGHTQWVIVKLFKRQQGVMLKRNFVGSILLEDLAQPQIRWVARQAGAGSQHALETQLYHHGIDPRVLQVVATEPTERQAASLLARSLADCAPGVRAAAAEFGLDFVPLGWESFDLVLPRTVFFRQLFQEMLAIFRADKMQQLASALGGYDLDILGRVSKL